ncbi:ABC transporter substrate-binding protein [Moritella sp. F3]|uniref:ABC transporter substrate-binding protein n=1 Tax=Moritella sp. F3 TaxID=2718882 RepID=UPI0018E13F9F|nr:ABC transporter substrate-binding protein [Moritella sp. F3]GIC77757.1 ABC transporter substrate-binding protein [Moritella sp. F1]GIC83102.1 ABC transporter substrate-binding protein [Moritella sp. F3]
MTSPLLSVSAAVLLLTSTLGFSQKINAADILTATPVTYMLATELTKGTDITTQYLPPKRYGISRLPNWFSSKGATLTEKAAIDAQVAITLGAVWPQDPLFVHARKGNIRMIEVDASQAISPRAQGVAALRLDDGTISAYTWLNPTNLTRMTAIVSQDLQQIWPQQAATITSNQQALMMSVRHLINQQQAMLLDNEIDSVVLLSTELEDFASGNQLFVVERLTKPELEWTAEDKQELVALLTEDDSLWILTSKRASKQLKALVPNPTRILTIDSIDRWGRGIKADKPLQRWQLAL